MTTYEEVSFLCAAIAKQRSEVGGAAIPGGPVMGMMAIHALTNNMQWAKDGWSLVDGGQEFSKDGETCKFTVEFRVPVGAERLHVVVHVKGEGKPGMYHVQMMSAARTIYIYDELALSTLAAEAASQVRRGFLESAFSRTIS